jgi:hypothetical protein
LGAERVVHFTAEGETVPPEITEVTALDENGEAVQRDGADYVLEAVYAENAGWESGYKLLFRFSEEVDVSSFKKAVSVEPALPFAIETRTAVADAVILSFTERPVFGWRYVIRVDIGIKDKLGNESLHPKAYRIYVDGKKSKLPVFKKLEIASNGVSAAYEADDNFKPLEQTSDDEAVVTLWFETAEGADVQLYSVMECFSVSSTNNAVSFTPLSIAYGTAESGESRPVVITGALNVKAIESGVVTFSIGSGLLDSYGNKQPDAWKLVLLK